MKKILIIIATIFLNIQLVYAKEVETYKRTENNYLVPSDIKVTAKNKSNVLATPAVDATEKIYDFADLLSDEEEDILYELVSSSIKHIKYDLVIVTIAHNNKHNAMEYADDFFDYNDFGKNSSRDGLLILIDMDTREIYISTSGMAIKMYSDYRIDSIIDAGYYDLKNGKYYNCLSKMVNKMTKYYDNGFPTSENKNLYIDKNGNVVKRMPYFVVFFIGVIVSLIMSLILYFKTRLKIKKQTTVTYINPETSNIAKQDIFLTTHTSRIKITHSSGSGGGGSSFHSGSSGRSHGGGGRHF